MLDFSRLTQQAQTMYNQAHLALPRFQQIQVDVENLLLAIVEGADDSIGQLILRECGANLGVMAEELQRDLAARPPPAHLRRHPQRSDPPLAPMCSGDRPVPHPRPSAAVR